MVNGKWELETGASAGKWRMENGKWELETGKSKSGGPTPNSQQLLLLLLLLPITKSHLPVTSYQLPLDIVGLKP